MTQHNPWKYSTFFNTNTLLRAMAEDVLLLERALSLHSPSEELEDALDCLCADVLDVITAFDRMAPSVVLVADNVENAADEAVVDVVPAKKVMQ
jgi:hypothetical protein